MYNAVCGLKQLICVLCCLFSDGDEIDSPGSTPTSHLSGNTPLSNNPANLSISNLQTCKHLLTELSGAGQNNQEITTKGDYTLCKNLHLMIESVCLSITHKYLPCVNLLKQMTRIPLKILVDS